MPRDDAGMEPYRPLDVLKPVDDGLWIVDGPIVSMRYVVGHLPFPTRMTIIRLPDGGLWVHSPTVLTDDLKAAVEALGPVRWLIAPNRLHWMALGAWQAAFPEAVTHAAPKVELKAADGGFEVDAVLTDTAPAAWTGAIGQVLVPGRFMTEAVFFHRTTATLIVTDLIENFERDRLRSRFLTLLMWVGGVLHPHGGTPRDLRLTFLGRGTAVKAAAETMLGWAPRRIILAHGRCIEEDATAVLAHALAWTGVKGH